MQIVGVRVKDEVLYFDKLDVELSDNNLVVVESSFGLEIGKVFLVEVSKCDQSLINTKKFLRRIDVNDYELNIKNDNDYLDILKRVRKEVTNSGLKMNIISVYYTLDRNKLLIEYVADNRVDFRKLARDLASIYKTRIELKQIGVRDKTKSVGGLGCCGYEVCCKRFLTCFDPVSINMAKNQDIALNPNRINGLCGRLKCCLRNEEDVYEKHRNLLPKLGEIFTGLNGRGKIIGLDILSLTYVINYKEKGIYEEKLSN